jgi:RNA 2',3'-cyclic 3'-phosphodiesterase
MEEHRNIFVLTSTHFHQHESAMKRLFLAIDLPERIIEIMTDTYRALRGVRWIYEQQLHLTLHFFGETSEDRETAIISSLRNVQCDPFSLNLKGAGCFPPRRETRVLWIGLEKSKELLRLHSQIGQCITSCGFTGEHRRFSPHVTVARLNGVHSDTVARYLAENSLLTSEPFEVNVFHLYRSILGKNGAQYHKEASFYLR